MAATHPHYEQAQYCIGLIQLAEKRPAASVATLRPVLASPGLDAAGRAPIAEALAQALAELGSEHFLAGRLAPARTALEESIALRPGAGSLSARKQLGFVLRHLGLHRAAAESFRLAVAEGPVDAEAHANLALVLQHLGENAAAERSFEEAIRLQPKFAAAHVALGRMHSVYRPRRAIQAFEAALAIDPALAEARVGLAGARAEACEWAGREQLIAQVRLLQRGA